MDEASTQTPTTAGDASTEAAKEADSTLSSQERLFALCELGQYEEVAAMLQGRRGLFLNCVNSRGETPLHVVRDKRCAELLLDFSGGSQAALNRQNSDGETPLMVALRLGDSGMADLLLDNGADARAPNKNFQSCLHAAARSGLAGVLDRLLNMRQLDPNQVDRAGNTPLHYAVTCEDRGKAEPAVARLLQETQLTVDSPDVLGRSAFVLAVQSGNLAACRLLRDRGCDLCRADSSGADALHAAAATNRPDAVRYLISELAFSVNRSDKLGRTPLFYAIHHGADLALAELLALGAESNTRDRLGRTGVHVAGERGQEACLVRLLEAGAAPWTADVAGRTPLHLASLCGHKELVKRLLRCDAPAGSAGVGARDLEGKTARELALEAGHHQVAEMLAQAAAAAENRGRQQQRGLGLGLGSFPKPRSAAGVAKARKREEERRVLKEGEKYDKPRDLPDGSVRRSPPLIPSAPFYVQNSPPERPLAWPLSHRSEDAYAKPEAPAYSLSSVSTSPAIASMEDLQTTHVATEQDSRAAFAEAFDVSHQREQDEGSKMPPQTQADSAAIPISDAGEVTVDSGNAPDSCDLTIERVQEPQLTGAFNRSDPSGLSSLSSSSSTLASLTPRQQATEPVTEHQVASLTVSAVPPSLKAVSDDRPGSSSSAARVAQVVGGDSRGSSRPSSHLDEELHGDQRTREAAESRDDPYLTAHPAWITGTAKPKSPRQQHRLRRSKKVAPEIAALRQRLAMYDSNEMLGRLLREEHRERMLLRVGFPRPPLFPSTTAARPQNSRLRIRRPVRPSTAAEVERLSERRWDVNRETRQLLEKWKAESSTETPRTPSSTSVVPDAQGRPKSRQRQKNEETEAGRLHHNQQQQLPPQRRPKSANKFLDYFPNNMPPASDCADGDEAAKPETGNPRRQGERPKSGKRSAGWRQRVD